MTLDHDQRTATSSSTTTSNEDVENSDIEKGLEQTKTSLPEFDSGLSENELCPPSAPLKLSQILHPPAAPSSDVESGFSGDYSPHNQNSSSTFILQHQSSIDTNDLPTLERIALELNSIALDWRSYHAPVHCACSLPFDTVQRKVRSRLSFSFQNRISRFLFCVLV